MYAEMWPSRSKRLAMPSSTCASSARYTVARPIDGCVARMRGSRVSASSILNDPNADPHEYEASPAAAKQVADAKLVIVNGIGYDDFMDRLIGASTKPDRIVINVQDLLGVKDDVNVHVWYDPATMPKVADAATDALSKLDPQSAGYFAAQKAKYLAGLKAISDKIAALNTK